MTREEVLGKLRDMLRVAYEESPSAEALREAIALLTPPTDAKLTWVRNWVDHIPTAVKSLGDGTFWTLPEELGHAVDALAREPGLLEQLQRTQEWLDKFQGEAAQGTVEMMQLTRRVAEQDALIAEWNEARAEKDSEIEHLTGEVAHLLERQERQGRALQESEEWLRAAVAEDKDTWAFLSCWLHLVDVFVGDPERPEMVSSETEQK
jgi:uncharacterized coiled-coil protein SlyX